jgi:hypothetical protein
MNFNLLTDAVLALYDDVELLARDEVLAKSLDTFQGSMAAFSRCVENCGMNVHDPVSAACNILTRLFESTVEHETSTKIEPFAFDEAAVVLRETEHLARIVTTSCDLALESICVAAARCGVPAPIPAVSRCSNDSVTDMAQAAREKITSLNDVLGVFLKDAVRLFDVRVVAPVEIEKKLGFCLSQWQSFSASQQQQISQCVAAELQCRLEWKWFSSFSKELLGEVGSSASAYCVRFEQEWLKNWNRRREALQDQFSFAADFVLVAARSAIAKFPDGDVTHEPSFTLEPNARSHVDSGLRFVKLPHYTGLDQAHNTSSQRQAIRRPREKLRRALEYSSPSPMLTVVSLTPECEPPSPVQVLSHQVLRQPKSRSNHSREPSPLFVRKL